MEVWGRKRQTIWVKDNSFAKNVEYGGRPETLHGWKFKLKTSLERAYSQSGEVLKSVENKKEDVTSEDIKAYDKRPARSRRSI